MKWKSLFVLLLAFAAATSVSADKKKKQPNRAMLEKMEAVPCGAKQKGLSGLGSFWASVGVTHLNSNEKLCPQYLLRTDEMDYEVRPRDLKHPAILPVGQEVVIKIKKDNMFVKCPEGDKKERAYEVVAMKPLEADSQSASAKTEKSERP